MPICMLQLCVILENKMLKKLKLQLNNYETEPYFLQFFQMNTTVCLIIHVFCEVNIEDIKLHAAETRQASPNQAI